MSEMDELNEARYKLTAALGEKSKQYFQRMKMWFQMKISKEEFDIESRKQMTSEQIHLHNHFLLCLFTKCQGIATASYVKATSSRSQGDEVHADSDEILSPSERAKKVKMNRRRNHTDRGGFEPIEVVDYLPSLQPPTYQLMDDLHRSCAQEFFLPDQSFLMGRLMLAAWDCGMDGANEAAADILVTAVQLFLKNMLTAIFSQRNGYRVRDGHIVYGMGRPASNPWLRNTNRIPKDYSATDSLDHDQDIADQANMDDNFDIHVSKLQPSSEELERRSNLEMACSVTDRPSAPPLSPWDVLEALQVHRNKVCSQSVYAVNVERVLNKLSHPTWDDEEAAAARARGRTN